MADVAILIPLMRPHRIAPVVETIAESTKDYRIVVIATGECADAARGLPVELLEDGGGSWPQRINAGYRITNEPFVFTGADDLAFRPGWFEAAERTMNTLPDSSGVVAINDLLNRAGVHFFISRHYIETFGGVIDQPPGVIANEEYRHTFCDDELRATAKLRGRWAFSEESVIEHLHAGAGKAPMDETYRIGEESMNQGSQLFHSRSHLWA